MRPFFLFMLFVTVSSPCHADRLELLRWKEGGELNRLGEIELAGEPGVMPLGASLKVHIVPKKVGAFTQWEVSIRNESEDIERLVLRIRIEGRGSGGSFWDGYHVHLKPAKEVVPTTRRYRFPAAAYLNGGRAQVVGFAPENLSSRFERSLRVNEGKEEMVWDAYLALHPGQQDRQVFINGELEDCGDYTEVIEAYYLAYPAWFRPVTGADRRIYGEGGFIRSRAEARDIQNEDSRRALLDWEWYYAPFQRAGAVMPDSTTWDASYGWNLEQNLAIYDQMDGLEGWMKYNTERISAGDRTTAIFYYYLQQYSSVDLLKTTFTDSYWVDKNGKQVPATFGWIKPELWVQFSWPGETLYGQRLRHDLAKAWEAFAIAGYALDCVIGDTPYYGEALPKEQGKAFDDKGNVYAVEGIAIARNLKYTHELPPRADGRRPASISNEAMTYHGIFFSDAMMHEKPPYERADLLPLRRFLSGQKPVYWWSGSYRLDSTLNWENISRDEFQNAAQGAVDFVILSSLRYGGVPAVFMVTGHPEVRGWIPRLIEMQRAGWRAATYTRVPEAFRPRDGDPYAAEAEIWIGRYGSGEESWITVSSPKRERKKLPLEIATQRFSGKRLLYLHEKGEECYNRISEAGTTVDVTLEDHQPVVLKAVAEVEGNVEGQLIVTGAEDRQGGERLCIRYTGKGNEVAQVRFLGEEGWRTLSSDQATAEHARAPIFRFLPNDHWIEEISLGDDKQSAAVVLVHPEDRKDKGLEARVLQLAHYWEYYKMRMKAPGGALSSVYTVRNPALAARVVDSYEAAEVRQAGTIFVLGERARKLVQGSTVNAGDGIHTQLKDGQRMIFVQPGDRNEDFLWGAFLARLDERFPYVGVLDHGPMYKHHEMGGTTFERKPKQ